MYESGAVDGAPKYMSSTKGELHGQTAMAVMSKLLLDVHDASDTKIFLHRDNKRVQQTCSHLHINRLKHHRKSDMDLKMEYHKATMGRNVSNAWIRGHQDNDKPWNDINDLKEMKLSNTAIMNTWCNKWLIDPRLQTFLT